MSFRLDRFATLYMAKPLHWVTSSRKLLVPILMYHSISDDPETGVHPYYRTATSPQVFASQMKYLHDSGYHAVSLEEVVGQLQGRGEALDKKIAITFDDGYRDVYSEAFPILNGLGFTATVFLPTAYIGDRMQRFKGKDCLTWTEVRELQKHGISFGSHTVTHPQLRDLSFSVINEEVQKSKRTIEDKLSGSTDSFAYPYAFPQADRTFTQRLGDLLQSAGYRMGVCTMIGRANSASHPLFMERLPVNSEDDMALFQAKLMGAYDWIAKPQLLAKLARNRARQMIRA